MASNNNSDNISYSQQAERGDLPLLPSERLWGFWEFTYANSALAIATWAFLIGGSTALFVGPKEGIAAIVIGNILGVLICSLSVCLPCGKYGVEQFAFLRSVFGPQGSRLVYLLSVVLLTLGWMVVLGLMFGRSIDGVMALLSPEHTVNTTGPWVLGVGVVAILFSAVIVAKGPTSIKFLNMVVSPVLVLVMVVMLVLILKTHTFAELMQLPALDPPFTNRQTNFMVAIEVNIAAGFSWWPYIGNLARLTKNQRTAFWPNIVGIFAAAVLGEVVGLLAAAALGEADPTIWMAKIGGVWFGVVALSFVAFANITSMTNLLYTALVGLRQLAGNTIKRLGWTMPALLSSVVPILGVLFAPGIYDGFFIFLVWTSALYSTLAGIGIADYFILRRQRVNLLAIYWPEQYPAYQYVCGFNPSALISLLAGNLFYVVLFNPQTLANAGAFMWISASLPTCLLSGIIYIVLTQLVAKKHVLGDYPVNLSVDERG